MFGIVVPASVALIVVVMPAPTALTSPLLLTVAALGFEEIRHLAGQILKSSVTVSSQHRQLFCASLCQRRRVRE